MKFIQIQEMPSPQRDQVSRDAAGVLRAGGLVIFPTETVYGVACNAADANAVARVQALADAAAVGPKPPGARFTWHGHDPHQVEVALEIAGPVHRRIARQVMPGPVRLVVERDPGALARILGTLGVPAGVVDDGASIAARVPDHDLARTIIRQAGVPIVAQRLSAFGWGSGRTAAEAVMEDKASKAGVEILIDEGPTRFGSPSTTIRLTAAGGYQIGAEGAWSAKMIERRIERVVLFVCTGNTCRSPMAEMIARGVFDLRSGPKVPMRFVSAGASAAPDMPMTPEARAAVLELGMKAGAFKSQELDKRMIGEADAIFTMTRSHARAVTGLDPGAKGKTQLLDPDGTDIADPIGQGDEAYRQAAAQIVRAIERRIDELQKADAADGIAVRPKAMATSGGS